MAGIVHAAGSEMSRELPEQGGVTSGESGGADSTVEISCAGHALVCEGRLVGVSSRFATLLGWSVETLQGRLVSDLFPSIAEWEKIRARLRAVWRSAQDGVWLRARLRKQGEEWGEYWVGVASWAGQGGQVWESWWLADGMGVEMPPKDPVHRERWLEVYQRLVELAWSEGPGEPRFDRMAEELSALTGFPIVTLEICQHEQATLVYRGVCGLDLADLPTPLEVPMDVSLSNRVVASGQMVIETEVGESPAQAAPLVRRWGIRTYVGVPLRAGSQLIGVLGLADRQPHPVTSDTIRLLAHLGDYVAMLLDRWQARESLRQSETELRAVYDQTPGIICLFDPQLRVVRANQAAAAFVGRPAESLLGLPPGAFLGCEACVRRGYECGTTPDCPACDLRQALISTFRDGKGWVRRQIQKTLLRESRPVETVLLVSTELVQSNGSDRVLLCLEDVTERTQAEMRIRSQAALLEVTKDAVLVRDFCDRILYWNEGASALYGWSAAEVQGRTTHELGFMVDAAQVSEAVAAVQERGEWSGEMRHRDRSGRELAVQSRWTLIRRSDGFPKAILIVNTDITERKRLENQLLRSQRLESIGTLASGLAHDLNNVLSPILMAVQYLKEEVRSEAALTCLQTLETCAQRGAAIIRQVLTFARGVEGTRVLVQWKHLVREVERIITETFPRSIQVQVRMTRRPWLVRGDPTQLQQVLMNLCVNARDAMPQGGLLTLRLDNQTLGEAEAQRLHVKARPGPYTVLSVQDTGVGIPAELLDKIFDPFFTTKPLGQGTGLGLATVLGIVESHGGFVLVESEVGKGSVFSVYLPALPQEEMGDTDLQPRSAPGRGQGQRVLVVDDEPAVRQITAAILRSHGYDPLLAADGQEGIAVWERQGSQIRAVITDLMMPRMDGPALVRKLRALAPELPIICITGLGEEARIGEARAAGARVSLAKPFTAYQLLEALEEVFKTPAGGAPGNGAGG
ncbi:MAG: PAS domain S-box protein [Verrucomicrobiota bacterium]|nr:PAS domain S-box protein [Limisphaera sp.]MDW8382365.1 PAS domain S-box protein [Verrucomicrobiota bacterium]